MFLLDLRKAFDTVDHCILLSKLAHNGFRGTSHKYTRSYLANREQYLVVDGIASNMKTVTKGVPQGSILGPLLFCLYINDIVYAVDTEVVLFADDAAFILTAPSLQLLYQRISKLFNDLSKYLSLNKLVPNLKKSKLMFFTSRPVPERLENLKFGSENIEWVSEMRYLGITLNSKMSFLPHINKTTSQVSRYSGVFKQLSKTIPLSVLKLLYFSFVLPHLTLHIEIWGSSPNCHLDRLATKQNILLRTILRIPYENGRPIIGTKEMYVNLGVLTIRNLYKLYLFKFMVQMLKGNMPFFYNLLLEPFGTTHNYNTRAGTFRHHLIACEVERRSVANQLIMMYETTNLDMYINTSIANSICKYKKYLLSNQ